MAQHFNLPISEISPSVLQRTAKRLASHANGSKVAVQEKHHYGTVLHPIVVVIIIIVTDWSNRQDSNSTPLTHQ